MGGTTYENIDVISIDSVGEDTDNFDIVISAPKYKNEIFEMLKLRFKEQNIYSFEAEIYYSFTRDIDSYRKYLINSYDRLEQMYLSLEDEKSKRTFINFIKGRISGNQDYYREVYCDNQYYPEDVITFSENEKMIEVGSNNGDTLKSFIKKLMANMTYVIALNQTRNFITY